MRPVRACVLAVCLAAALCFVGCASAPSQAETPTDDASSFPSISADDEGSAGASEQDGHAAQAPDDAATLASAIDAAASSGSARVAVSNAATGESVADASDQAAVSSALAELASALRDPSARVQAASDASAELRFAVSSTQTVQATQCTVKESDVEAAEVVTFAGSDVLQVTDPETSTAVLIDAPGAADALRALAG